MPAAPDAPSFLTTFAPEIRNTIYKLLFDKEGTIEFESCGPWHDTSRLSKTEVASALPLLQTCRQIYCEAASVLYLDNRFTLFPDVPHDAVTKWSIRIGSQLQLLRQVTVGLDAFDTKNYGSTLHFSVLPILRVIWTTEATLQITLHQRTRPRYGYSGTLYEVPNIDTFNRVLNSLGRRDSLDIKKFAGFKGLLKSIWVSEAVNWGTISFGSTSAARTVERNFAVLTKEGSLAMDPFRRSKQLLNMPSDVIQHIWSYAAYVPEGVIIDSATQDPVTLGMGMLRVSRHLRSDGMRHLFLSNRFIFKIPLKSARASSLDLFVLEGWERPFLRRVEGELALAKNMLSLPKHIEFAFELNRRRHPAPLEGIRINVCRFLELTMRAPGTSTISFRTSKDSQHDEHIKAPCSCFTLQKLRSNVFIALSFILQDLPNRRGKQ